MVKNRSLGIRRQRLRAKRRLQKAIIGCCLLLGVGTTGFSLAYLIDSEQSMGLVFEPAHVDCAISDTSDFAIKNTGNVPAYIRGAVVVNWVDEYGGVYGSMPMEGVDYTIHWNDNAWDLDASDQFYYYGPVVDVDESTGPMIERVDVYTNAPEGYMFRLEIVAEAIQSVPQEAVIDAWGVVLDDSLYMSKE